VRGSHVSNKLQLLKSKPDIIYSPSARIYFYQNKNFVAANDHLASKVINCHCRIIRICHRMPKLQIKPTHTS